MFWGPVYAKAFDSAGKKMEYAEYIVASLKGYVLEELKTWSVGSSYDDAPIFSIGDGVDKAEVKITLMVLPDDNGTVAFISLNNDTGFTIAGELFGSYANHNHQ
jgi:hypothetical protein